MPAQHGQPNRSHLTGEGGFKALLEIRNLALVKRVKFTSRRLSALWVSALVLSMCEGLMQPPSGLKPFWHDSQGRTAAPLPCGGPTLGWITQSLQD